MSRTRRAAIWAVVIMCLLGVGALGGCGKAGEAAEQVSLQLNWFHEAEFVGYYVAEAKGFYSDQDLAVDILEGGPGLPAREAVLNGTAAFAVTSFSEQQEMVAAGRPAVALMAAFQIPPLAIFSLTEALIRDPADLAGKRVGVTTDYWAKVLDDTLTAAGLDPAGVTKVRVEADQLQLLYDGEVDAWLGYAQDEPIKADMAGHPVTSIFPADFGVGGYEGLLIANEVTLRDKPDLVKRFLQASYAGWRYALEHPDEAAAVLDEWAPDLGLEFQKLAVRALAPLVDTPQVPVGWIDAARWQQLMGATYDPARPGYTMQFSPATP